MRRMNRQKLVVFGQRALQLREFQACFHADGQVARVVLQHGIHLRGAHRDIATFENIPRGSSRGPAKGHYCPVAFACEFQDGCCRGSILRLNQDRGRDLIQNVALKFTAALTAQTENRSNLFLQRKCHGRAHARAPSMTPGNFGVSTSLQVRGEGKIFSGFSRPSGLNAFRRRSITSRSSSENSIGIWSFFSMPTPCSPVMEPPSSTQYCKISFPAASVRRVCSSSRGSNRISGCRLPSPA